MTIVLQITGKQGFFVISVRDSGEIESEFYYKLCKTNPILEKPNECNSIFLFQKRNN
jgi:hypothetical protein